MPLERISADLPVLDRQVVHVPVRLEDVPVGDELRFGLDRVRDFLLPRGGRFGHDLAGEFAQRVAFDRDLEGLVVSEGGPMDLESAGDEFLFQEPEDFLGGAWGRERGAQVGIRIQDDPFRVDLASHVLDAFRGSLRGPAGIRLVPFLRADEGGKRFVHTRPPLRRGEVGRGFERLLLHLVLEGIDMEEEDPHGRPAYRPEV